MPSALPFASVKVAIFDGLRQLQKGLDPSEAMLVGIAALASVAARRLQPANLEGDNSHQPVDLPPWQPQMAANGTSAHHHSVAMNDLHRTWPYMKRSTG